MSLTVITKQVLVPARDNKAPNPCCQDMRNRRDGPGPRGGDFPDYTVTYCVVCESRHFQIDAEPGTYAMRNS
jgi:hypothetical protein